VWWYNGHPHGGDVGVDLSGVRSVAVLGLGNVALDCARLLLGPPERLAASDVAERALQQLRRSGVREVHLIARRGPAEVRDLADALPRDTRSRSPYGLSLPVPLSCCSQARRGDRHFPS